MTDYRDDIERYLRGDMTPAEMHALERKALEDPFLADALEGASGISPDEFSSDIKELKQRISRKAKPSSMPWYYQAAAAVLLVGISAVMILYLSGREEPDNSITLNTLPQPEASQKAPVSPEQESSQQSSEIADTKDDTGAQTPRASREEVADAPKLAESGKKVEEDVELDIAQERESIPQIAEDGPEELLLEQEQKTAPAVAQSDPPQAAARSFRARGAEANSRIVDGKVLRGRVTDAEDGLPLPGVNVVVKGTEIGAVTDLNGYYEINAPATAQTLVFSFIGLNTVEAAVPESTGDSATVDAELTPDVASLSEVVVTGYGTESEFGFEEIKWEPAEPEGGKRAFRRYLETNLRYPRTALENGIEGKVTVAFTIEPSGDLTDFRVVRSLGYGCDEEVIRLIREGPRWKPTRRNDEPVRGKGRVKMKFDLSQQKK